MTMRHEIDRYFSELKAAIETLDREAILHLTRMLMDAWRQDRMVILMGNGGSAATAAHMVNDLNKIVVPGMPRFHALALTDNTPLLTAWANDAAYERIFAEQMPNYCRPGDLVIAFSCSGNSLNVLEGIKAAQEIGAYVIGVTGNDGGALVRHHGLLYLRAGRLHRSARRYPLDARSPGTRACCADGEPH